MEILGYIVLAISILITLGWCLKIREKAKNEQAREKSMELQGFLMTTSIAIIFILKISPFHLLWMIPASFVLGLLSMTTPLKLLWIFSSMYFFLWYIGISNTGRKFYVDGDYDKAIEAFKNQIGNKPTAEAYFNLALAYGKKGQIINEIEAYQQSIKLNPKRPESYFNLAIAYNESGNKDIAIELINDAIELKPEYVKAHYWACKLYTEIGDIENAKKEFEKVKKLDERSADELVKSINFA